MRLSVAFDGDLPGDDGPMLALTPAAQPQTLTIETLAHGWIVRLSFDDSYHGLSASLLGPLTGL